MSATKKPQSEHISKNFEVFYENLSKEDRRRILYVVDYILNYKKGWRHLHELSELGFLVEVSKLKELNIVEEIEEKDYKGNRYKILAIHQDVANLVKAFVEKEFYPLVSDEEAIRQRLSKIVEKYFKVCMKVYERLLEFEESTSVTLFYDGYDREAQEFGKNFSNQELGFLVGYRSASWQTYHKELVFREKPVDIKRLFIEVMKAELERRLGGLTETEKWYLYLKYLKPDAREEFFVTNRAKFTRQEMRNANKRIPNIKSKVYDEIVEPILHETREKMSRAIRSLFLRDVHFLHTLSILLSFGSEQNTFVNFSSFQFEKLKEISSESYATVKEYLDDLLREGIIVKEYNDYLVPSFVREIFVNETRGNILEVKIFSDRLDAESFFYDLFGKAEKLIRIWDPYYSAETLDLVNSGLNVSKSNPEIEILTSCPSGYSSINDKSLRRHISILEKRDLKVRIKAIFKKTVRCESPFHDRYIILDDREVWKVGSSLHHIGKKGEMALQLKKKLGDLIIKAFENYWGKEELEEWQVLSQDGKPSSEDRQP